MAAPPGPTRRWWPGWGVPAVLAAHDVLGVELEEFDGVWEPGSELASATALLDVLGPLLSGVQPISA